MHSVMSIYLSKQGYDVCYLLLSLMQVEKTTISVTISYSPLSLSLSSTILLQKWVMQCEDGIGQLGVWPLSIFNPLHVWKLTPAFDINKFNMFTLCLCAVSCNCVYDHHIFSIAFKFLLSCLSKQIEGPLPPFCNRCPSDVTNACIGISWWNSFVVINLVVHDGL